ncbi:MAG: pyridoxal-phosphate dependent enzyme, partial [Mycobacterium sp.]
MNHIPPADTSELHGSGVAGRYPTLGSHRRPEGLVGQTPTLWISAPLGTADRGFWAKLEGFNPGGSMKDRSALYMVERGRARGELRPGATIVVSTSGSLGLGLALAG